MKKIFITGGTGFLGKEVILRLKKENYSLSGLARSEQSKIRLEELGVEPIVGDLENIEAWQECLAGTAIVIHCAAPVVFWGAWELYQKGIVDATANLYKAAETHKVSQFIYISSESVLQAKKDLIAIDETEPYPKEPNSYYGKSKMLAEQFILAQEGKMKSIILRPTFIWGKGVKALETIIEKIKAKDFMWINNGKSWLEMVHVKNVAEAIFLTIKNGGDKDKEIYFVTDGNPQTTHSFLTKLIQTQGVIPPKKNIPKGLANFLARIIEWIWKTFRLKSIPMLTTFDVAFVAMSRKYNITKIKKQLAYKPILIEEEGLKELNI